MKRGGVWKDRPRHDKFSHYADAFRYLACAYEEVKPPAEQPKPKPLVTQYTPNSLWEDLKRVQTIRVQF